MLQSTKNDTHVSTKCVYKAVMCYGSTETNVHAVYFILQKQKQPKETSVSLKVDSMLEVVSTMDKRVQSLSEQTAKLEKMMLHFTQEQERHFDRGRQRRYYRLHSISEPNITAEDESFNDDV